MLSLRSHGHRTEANALHTAMPVIPCTSGPRVHATQPKGFSKDMFLKRFLFAILMASTVAATAQERGHVHDHRARGSASTPFGEPAHHGKASRTVQVELSDRMRFVPAELTIKRGDTVRFVLKNAGKIAHEFVLGTMKDLKAHADGMRNHPGMEHEEANMAHVAPGTRATLAWRFTQAGEFHYGCLIPGHFEAGMVGRITVK